MHTDKIYQIGFHISMLNPEDWKPTGSIVTLRVQPADDTGQPEAEAKESTLTPDNEIIACAKCGENIGTLNLRFDYKGNTVCVGCYAKLMGQKYQKNTLGAWFG